MTNRQTTVLSQSALGSRSSYVFPFESKNFSKFVIVLR